MVLHPSEKYEMKQEGPSVNLLIHSVKPEDGGDYTCYSGDQQTTASLTVKGRTKAHRSFSIVIASSHIFTINYVYVC